MIVLVGRTCLYFYLLNCRHRDLISVSKVESVPTSSTFTMSLVGPYFLDCLLDLSCRLTTLCGLSTHSESVGGVKTSATCGVVEYRRLFFRSMGPGVTKSFSESLSLVAGFLVSLTGLSCFSFRARFR